MLPLVQVLTQRRAGSRVEPLDRRREERGIVEHNPDGLLGRACRVGSDEGPVDQPRRAERLGPETNVPRRLVSPAHAAVALEQIQGVVGRPAGGSGDEPDFAVAVPVDVCNAAEHGARCPCRALVEIRLQFARERVLPQHVPVRIRHDERVEINLPLGRFAARRRRGWPEGSRVRLPRGPRSPQQQQDDRRGNPHQPHSDEPSAREQRFRQAVRRLAARRHRRGRPGRRAARRLLRARARARVDALGGQEPDVDLPGNGEDALGPRLSEAAHGQAEVLLPPLHRAHAAPEVRGDVLPAIELGGTGWDFRRGGRRGHRAT